MNDLRKAAEMALKYLENSSPETDTLVQVEPHVWEHRGSLAIQALRQALAQPEQEQKTPLKVLNLSVFAGNRLRNGRVYDVETLQTMTNRDILAIPDMGKKALKEVLEALAAYASDMSQERVDEKIKGEHKREWVGLTDKERADWHSMGLVGVEIVAAHLKEKNHG